MRGRQPSRLIDVPSLDSIVRHQTALGREEVALLHRLVADWQLLADLAFGDLVLWVLDAEAKGYWAAAQIRPTTGATTLADDVVGTFVPAVHAPDLVRAAANPHLSTEVDEVEVDGEPVSVRYVPVRRRNRLVALVEHRSSVGALRRPSRLEDAYLEAARTLEAMLTAGTFPTESDSELAGSLRVGDGMVRLDARGTVTYASPNAVSAYRRLGVTGGLVGTELAALTQGLVGPRRTDSAPLTMLGGRTPDEGEVEGPGATLLVRVVPLSRGGEHDGALVLLRDVTELRVRERELLSKDATIREIHHRVKNNLQTVAALLRLQARRMDSPQARTALVEAEQRVGSIALVHETLSQSFDETVAFDDVADQLLRSVLEVATADGLQVEGHRIGSFGQVSAEVATPLALVLTEIVQNAGEHAFAGRSSGRVTVAVNRIRNRLRLRVGDDGAGLPDGFDPRSSLGLSIVATLVESELDGRLTFDSRPGAGTTVSIELTL